MTCDLNYLYHRQQVALIRADYAPTVEARRGQQRIAGRYRELISNYKRDRAARM
ncbi:MULTISPECIES: hypothetical protein [Sphingomonas]|uniref:hypothetical protein n=1 Tax=Sphingomonas TaxID=13687 RepID=UPI0013E351BB|nr:MULTISPECIES: hypothetical protein [Sphingomonas]